MPQWPIDGLCLPPGPLIGFFVGWAGFQQLIEQIYAATFLFYISANTFHAVIGRSLNLYRKPCRIGPG